MTSAAVPANARLKHPHLPRQTGRGAVIELQGAFRPPHPHVEEKEQLRLNLKPRSAPQRIAHIVSHRSHDNSISRGK